MDVSIQFKPHIPCLQCTGKDESVNAKLHYFGKL